MSNLATLITPQKGERYGGRQKGTQNLTTRCLKHALLLAAEESDHCPEGKQSLAGYCLWLANEKPELYVSMLARLIPQQLKAEINNAPPQRLDPSMPLDALISAFEMKIKSDYRPRAVIEHDEQDNTTDD